MQSLCIGDDDRLFYYLVGVRPPPTLRFLFSSFLFPPPFAPRASIHCCWLLGRSRRLLSPCPSDRSARLSLSLSLVPHLFLFLSLTTTSLYPCEKSLILITSLRFSIFFFCQASFLSLSISLSLVSLLVLKSFSLSSFFFRGGGDSTFVQWVTFLRRLVFIHRCPSIY